MIKNPVKILLVDDDEDDYLIIKGSLLDTMQPKPEVQWISRYDEAREEILQGHHDVYLIDYRLGEQNGLDLLVDLELPQRSEPFIILTGAGDESVERKAMELGASDYLVKGQFQAELLRRVIEYSLQRKLMEAQRIRHLVDLSRSKDEFIAVTSHQLRTPATAVKQYLGVLLGGYAGDIPEQQESLLKRAYATNERQLKIVDDILRTAQLDLQKVELHPEQVDIRELVQRCVQDLKLTMENRNQTIELKLPSSKLLVECDLAFTVMAISNILDNASKYSEHDTAIKVEVLQVGAHAQIAITDQGVGISKDDTDRLFKKFSRVDNPLSVEVGGTGLGLYWAKAVIVIQGGDITVRSELGEGSTFMITLPLAARARAKKAAKGGARGRR